MDKKKIELGWQARGGEILRTWTFTDRDAAKVNVSAYVRAELSATAAPWHVAVVTVNGTMIHLSEHASQRDAARDCERAYDRAMMLRTLPGQRQPSDHDLEEDDDCEKSDA